MATETDAPDDKVVGLDPLEHLHPESKTRVSHITTSDNNSRHDIKHLLQEVPDSVPHGQGQVPHFTEEMSGPQRNAQSYAPEGSCHPAMHEDLSRVRKRCRRLAASRAH